MGMYGLEGSNYLAMARVGPKKSFFVKDGFPESARSSRDLETLSCLLFLLVF